MRRFLVILVIIVVAGEGCVDGPFGRTNPFDPESPMSMEIVGGIDTASTVGQTMLFQLVTDPVVIGFEPTWGSGTPTLVISLGLGRFTVVALPVGSAAEVMVRANFGSRVVERSLVVMPPAP